MDREELIGFGIWLAQFVGYTAALSGIGLGFAFAFFLSAGGWR